jgi:hypothetical protein
MMPAVALYASVTEIVILMYGEKLMSTHKQSEKCSGRLGLVGYENKTHITEISNTDSDKLQEKKIN